jgi:hypothetical protein
VFLIENLQFPLQRVALIIGKGAGHAVELTPKPW